MALNGVFDLSQTPGSNTDFLGTSVLGTGLVSTADDSLRNLASFLARWRDDLGGTATTSGNDTITVTLNQSFAAYASGEMFIVKLGGTNTGACTLNATPSGGAALGAKNIKYLLSGVSTDPTAGMLTTGNYAWFKYDGTNMILLNPPITGLPASGTAGQSLTIVGSTPTWGSGLILGTSTASTSGTSIDYTGIPSWVRRITVNFDGMSTNGTSVPIIQLGSSSGGIETSGYLGTSLVANGGGNGVTSSTTGIGVSSGWGAANVISGAVIITLVKSSTNTWSATSSLGLSNSPQFYGLGYSKSLSSTLDRVRLTMTNGTDAFDLGTVNITYE